MRFGSKLYLFPFVLVLAVVLVLAIAAASLACAAAGIIASGAAAPAIDAARTVSAPAEAGEAEEVAPVLARLR